MVKDSAVLARAAALVEKGWNQGWWQKRGDDGETCYCIIGALDHARTCEPFSRTSISENYIRKAIIEKEGEEMGPVMWNDREGRTQAEVVALLLRAAELARDVGQ
jgi:hypothetical protein